MAALSPFSPFLPNWQTVWDSTALGWLKTCPKLYQYQMLDQWEPRNKGIHLVFGGLYAASLERYAHAKASGLSHDDSTRAMVRWAMENSGDRTCLHCEGAGEIEEGDLYPECPECNGTGQGPWRAWDPSLNPDGTPNPDANVKNRYTLLRSLVWNVEDRALSPFTTLIRANGKPAVELTFNFEAFSIDGEAVSLSGHLDEVVEAFGQRFVRDDKTTKGSLGAQYFAQYTPNNQMSLYSVAGKVILDTPVAGVLVKAAQIGVGFTRFQTAQVTRPEAVLTEWMHDTEFWIRQAKGFAERGHWPMNDRSCFLCSFKSICKVSPSHREAHLRQDFRVRAWNPLEARGDI